MLSVLQSIILWLTFEVALIVFAPSGERPSVRLAICATVLAAAHPGAAAAIGSSFAEITTRELAARQAGCCSYGLRLPVPLTQRFCAATLGMAMALKMTNAVRSDRRRTAAPNADRPR